MPELDVYFQGVSKPEGPAFLPDGRMVITEMGSGIVSVIAGNPPDKHVLAQTGRPNGLAVAEDGTLWIAESRYPALLKLMPGGEVETISTGTAETPFLWPNDLCFGPDGALYMTDSGVLLENFEGIQPPTLAYSVEINGKLWRINPDDGVATILDTGLRFANGIAFGPGGSYVYVSETLTGNIYRYHIQPDGSLPEREYFSNVMRKPPFEHGRVAGPDGMAFDIEGNLWVAILVQGDIAVIQPNGRIREYIPLLGDFPTNLAFGERFVVITEASKNQLLTLRTSVHGLPLFT